MSWLTDAKDWATDSAHSLFKLPGEGIRMSAPGPHPGTSALRPPGGSMDWREQQREQQEVTREKQENNRMTKPLTLALTLQGKLCKVLDFAEWNK